MKSINYLWKDRKRRLGLPVSFEKYALTDDRFIIERGFLTQTCDETLLYRIRDLSLRRSLGQKIFGVGTVMIYSSDNTDPSLEVKNIKHPKQVMELLHVTVEEAKKKYRFRAGEYVTAPNMVDTDGDGLPD